MSRYLVLIGLFLSGLSQGHEIRPAFLQITQNDSLSSYKASFRQPQIAGRFLGLSLDTNCQQEAVSSSANRSALTEVFSLNCGEENLREIEIIGLDRTMIDTLITITTFYNGAEKNSTLLITADEPRIIISTENFGLPVYFSIGFEHLLNGYDHILFILMLIYLVHRPIDILKIVTIFTIAHSITLALSAFGIFKVSQAPVEAIIAGSIVLLASEIIRPSGTRKLVRLGSITFSFGLLHGLGFAGALTDIGLPPSNQISALFLFNLGLELGQLAIILLFLITARVTSIRNNKWLFTAPVYLSGGIGSYWFFERSLQIISPFMH